MKGPNQTLAALCAIAMTLALAAPASAERWFSGAPVATPHIPSGTYVAPQHGPRPIREHGQQQGYATPTTTVVPGHNGQTVIVTNGPLIIVPGTQSPRSQPSAWQANRYLPVHCLTRNAVGTGRLQLFDAGCLANSGVQLHALPARCAITVQGNRAYLRGYDPSCLRDAGYRMAGR